MRWEHYLLQMLLVYLPCLFYNPTLAAPFFFFFRGSCIFSRANLPSACVSFVSEYVYRRGEVQSDGGGV